MTVRVGALVALAVLAAASGSALAAGPVGQSIRFDFEGDKVGGLPPGFSVAQTGKGQPPRWAVTEDSSSLAGPKVLTQSSADATGNRFPLCIENALTTANVRLSVRFKPVSGRVDQGAGLVARFRDSGNYYVVRANALEGNVNLYKVVAGLRSEITGKPADLRTGDWRTLGLTVEGDRLQVSLDGQPLFEAQDPTFKAAGKVGLWTKADSVTEFDDFQAQALP
ncbi:hypothetical protein [Azospirillum canadense]|uniref:hypothetical protein n=1 Tax=Azospirillum canadense TaxID=403962 RepID=UPI002226050D|nr:hypothetical protein [Azospirillum canadense]MCW2238645.1 hypothetical protein [Azospirillum canadense]